MRIVTCWITLLAIAQLCPCPVLGSDSGFARKTLAGITGVSVVVEDVPPGAASLGLNKESIQTDTELKLRLAGMRVLTEKESLGMPGMPSLYIAVNVSPSGRAANVAVELQQNVRLVRDPTVLAFCTTWLAEVVAGNLNAQDTRDTVKDLVDKFLNGWLSVNPKK
jgi:hypothetical protein